jgi:3-deoxy-D-manno-octulosonic acid (KDO) 8-phosphate synthase
MGYDLGGYAAGGNPRLLKGPGDGMSDDIPAVIGRKQPARLADGEFVVPADVVSHLGNGSTDAGAKKLHQMMDKVRTDRTGKKRQAPEVNADKYLPGKKKASGGIAGYASGGIVGYASGGIAGYADGGEITSIYESYLGRTPSAAEIKSWQDTGASYDTISKGIRLSPEAAAFSSNAGNAEKIVTTLYKDQLGRAPDAGGLKFWSDALKNGQSVSDVTKGINQSIEGQNFDTQYITSLYRQNLARNPEQAGYQWWLSMAQDAGYTPKEIEAVLKQSATSEIAARNIDPNGNFTEMQLNALEADPYGGRYTTKSIYDLLPDAANVSTIGNQKAQFVNPVTQQPYVTNYGEGNWTQKVGTDVLNTPQVDAAIRVARANGTLSTAGYNTLIADLRAATTMDQTRAALAKPQGQVVIDAIYGQQIGENVDLAAAKAEAAKRQAVLNANDKGYYQNNTVLSKLYKDKDITVPFDYSAYNGVDTRTGQADVVTPENFQQRQNDLVKTLTTYKPTYPTLNRNTGLPPSVRDPYSDEGLKVLYGQMMDQYGPPPEGFVNPATFVPEPYTYKPPVSTTLQKEAAAKAAYDAKVAADRLAYDKAPLTAENFDETDYRTRYPDAFPGPGRAYQHYLEANANGDIRTANKLPFTPTPYAPTPLKTTTPAPAATTTTTTADSAATNGIGNVNNIVGVGNKAGGLLSIKHRRRA